VARQQLEPGLLDQAAALLFMPDLMHYLLTGHVAVEATIASTSQLIDPRTGTWAVDLVSELELPARILQPLVPAGTRLGAVRLEVAQDAGIAAEIPVIAPASHDTASAVAAVPATAGSSWCYLSSGTWSLMGAELNAPCLSAAARDAPFTNEGGVGGTSRFLRNITGLWLVQECRRSLEQQGATLEYAALTELARAAPPFRTLIDPAHGSFLTPGRMPEKIAAFAQSTGQPVPDDSGALIRCCLESLALAYRHTLSQLEVVLGRPTTVLHVVGGGGRNTLLNQMTADAIDRPVRVGPVEATAAGNVLVQAMGAGLVRDLEHLRAIVAASVEPDLYEPRDAGAWQGPYERFVELLGSGVDRNQPADATGETVR
jgi:rhamnulokinase